MINRGKPNIGDVVRIIGGILNYKKYRVTECPSQFKNTHGNRTDLWWTKAGSFDVGTEYELISQEAQIDPDFDVDKRMRQKRDDNLRRVFA